MSLQHFKEQEIVEFQKYRTEVFSEMFDNVNEYGIYPATVAYNKLDDWLSSHDLRLEQAIREEERGKIDENTSDGYHTFKELYEFRLLYNAGLFNEWAKQGLYNVHKSQRYFDGELCFDRDDYFVVVAELPNGQISNHYPMSDWDLFKCPDVPKALAQWDGHSSQDVAKRLRDLLTLK